MVAKPGDALMLVTVLETLTFGPMTGDSSQPRLSDTNRFEAAIRRFDAANSLDPNLEIVEGIARPRELVYAERLTQWVLKLCPDPSEELRLAARCQHICRWRVARSKSLLHESITPLRHLEFGSWRTGVFD